MESEKRYKVYEAHGDSLTTVLLTDCLAEAKARYATCYGAQRGAGGIWDNTTPKGKYGWVA